ncbi:P-loop containing nucleoside triphosphate hydrolase protein [Multifurca ochricompacta]|uniref:Eukaryotic peptide chain release factor GTP-binding subunit n=1 Tax=Multifurca ochricompacta TaxID=376703 RepID=A0AAD4QK19_9AGAM|nr:P-loop containing nucleoside triphosphate hydrolase protein [Multifurca ochricompacta]
MSRLNASAYEFVPGKKFVPVPAQQPPLSPPQQPPPLPEFTRPEEPDVPPPPPPTISLNIGGAKPAPALPPAVARNPVPAYIPSPSPAPPPEAKPQTKAAPTSSSSTPSRTPGSASPAPPAASLSSKTFTMGRAKTDTAAVAQEVAAVADQEVLEDLFGDIKEHLNIVFIGHVDAGKSTMGGNILYICGMVDKRTMEKYEREAKEAGRESWYLSWALDSTPQERAKGKTVEVGRAYFETNARRYTILDAPGHKTFVPSMISGAAQADVALLVISARKGEFETGFEKGGQTREHIMLVKTAGVNKVIVVINKMDDPTVKWDKARYEEIKEKLTPFVRGAGFHIKTDVSWLPVSAYTGANLKDRVSKSICSWWEGPSLLEHLDKLPMVDRKTNSPSGHIRKGDTLLLMPNKDEIEIAAVYNEMEEEVNVAISGDNVRIRIRGVEDDDISPGFVLTSLHKPVHAVRQFEAQLAILDHKNIICAGYSAVLHVHTLAEEVTLSAMLHYFDKATGRKSRKPPQFAKKGQRIVALIEAAAPICIERFSDYPQLGRFTLRDEGKTVAIGKVTRLIEGQLDELAEATANLTVNTVAVA